MIPTKSRREPLLLAGTVVVALVLGLSRWGTNLGLAPLFIGDLLVALAVIHVAVTGGLGRQFKRDDSVSGRPTLLLALFLSYFIVRWLGAIGQGTMMEWLRDGVPFAYSLLVLISAYSLARSGECTRARTFKTLRWALTFHIIWVAAVSFTGNAAGFDVLGPFGSAPAFAVRPDIDAALLSVAAAINLRQLILGRRRFWNLAGMTLAMAVVFLTSTTRAGQISLLVTLALAYALTFSGLRKASGRRLLMIFAVPVVIAAVLAVLPQTAAGQRLIATVMPQFSTGSSGETNAAGTQRARELTWQQVISWTNEDPMRAAFGSGFGNDFLSQSGTLEYLEGSTYDNVRSPHNWFVGIYARMGIVGVVLLGLWVFQTIALIWRLRARAGQDDLLAVSSLIFVAILPVATLGVVLEAPFGAIPFFWSAGIIAGSRPAVLALTARSAGDFPESFTAIASDQRHTRR